MLSAAALALVGFSISAAAVQIQSFNPSFSAAGIQGCIAVEENAAGEPLIIHDCNTEPDLANQDWSVSFYTRQPAGPQQIKVFGDKCIDVTGGVNADGTKLQIWDCADGNTNQLWTSFNDNSLQWSGTDKCIDLSDGSITDGNVLQIWTCASGSQNQGWIGEKNPDTTDVNNLVASNSGFDGFCIAAASNTDGAAVALAGCEKRQLPRHVPQRQHYLDCPGSPPLRTNQDLRQQMYRRAERVERQWCQAPDLDLCGG
ncbi:ricin B lectin domain-containing protein [Mycena olivaceomarginata]|nr:ricin B lectin domain-containing protein [Mycena olivaceomarginata]